MYEHILYRYTLLQAVDGSQIEEVHEYEEIEEDDRDRFCDQLKAVAMLGRTVADHALPLLGR